MKGKSYLINFGSKGKLQEKQYSDTLTASMGTGGGNVPIIIEGDKMDKLRIRKLTPKECWRLMGFDDIDFDKASKLNSNTQLYKQAGNSIVVNVLEAILRNLLPKSNKENAIEMTKEEFYLVDLKSRFDKIKPNTYYLAYSGGKDSHFLYWFIKEYLKRDDIKIVGINTYMEHHEIRDRILKNSDIVLYPKTKPMEIKEKYGSPCFSKIQDEYIDRYQKGCRTESLMTHIYPRKFIGRDGKEHNSSFVLNNTARRLLLSGELHRVSNKCCYYLKKKTAHDYEKETGLKAILGVRSAEGHLRKSQYTSCFTKDKKFTPIHDLSDEILEKIIKKYNIEVPEVYKYIDRTGCMGCPYGSYKGDTQKELELINEAQFNFVCKYFKESYQVLGIRPERQLKLDFEEKE